MYSIELLDKQLDPILLIPGLAGSMLEAKLILPESEPDPDHCLKKSTWNNAYLNLQQIYLNVDCFVSILKLKFSTTSNKFTSWPNVEMRVKDKGKLNGIEQLDDSNPAVKYASTYFGSLTYILKKAGYVEGVNMFGNPYDWRQTVKQFERDAYDPQGGDESSAQGMFKDLKTQIENAYSMQNMPVTVVTHSMGGLVFNYFLNTYVPQEWIDVYVKRFVAVSCPWGGSIRSIQSLLSGDNLNMPFIPLTHFLKATRTFPAAQQLFSVRDLMDNDVQSKYFIEAGDQRQSMDELPLILTKLNLEYELQTQQFILQNKLRIDDMKILANVPITIIQSNKLKTVNKLIQVDDFNPDSDLKNAQLEQGDGDDTVNIESLEYYTRQQNYDYNRVHTHLINGIDHLGILKNNEFINLIKKLLEIDLKDTVQQ